MRTLVIGHTYVAEDNRAKWRSIARIGSMEIDLHLPHRWPSWEHDYHPVPETHPGFRIHVAHALRTGREDQYFFAPGFFRRMTNGAYDVLHVEQGTTSLAYAQALLERGLVSRTTRSCFFTWINWETRLPFPWSTVGRFNLRRSHGAIGGNADAVDILKRHGFRGKTAVIPQIGVDPVFYAPGLNPALRERLQLRAFVIGFMGRLVEEKGIRILLEAARTLGPDVSVLVIGTGPFEQVLSEYRDKLHLVHVKAVPHHEVRDYLRVMNVLTLPSFVIPTWKEQFGHILIEAMACEIPVIGSNSAAIPEVIGDAGLLFPEKSVEGLRDRIEQLRKNPSEGARLAKMGRQRVLERFTHEKIGRQTMEFWKTL